MDEYKWTKHRKDLCAEFWDDCAQELCDIPCLRILEAEKKNIITQEEQRRIDLANQQIKIKHIMNVGVFYEGKLIKDGFKDAYSARNFMNDAFFVGSRTNKINLLNPYDFGWSVQLIETKIEILNENEIKQILEGD